MKIRIPRTILAALLLLPTFHLQLSTLFAQATAFTYQGRLNDGPLLANGLYDLKFTLFDSPAGGGAAGPLTNSAVAVSNGLFTVVLDFGPNVFNGLPNFFLEIGVRAAGVGEFTTLNPRQPVTPSPYAIHAASATKLFNGAVTRLNSLSNNVTLAAGQNVTITPSGNTLTIGASGINPWQVNGTNTFYNAGRVGIGTSAPTHTMHIASPEPTLALQDSDSTTQQVGYISYRDSGNVERAWVGYGTAGSPVFSIVNARSGSAGHIALLPFAGNVGIGTTTPQVRLDVRGSVKMGTSGEFFATGGEENLRIVRGIVSENGNILRGLGFTVARTPPSSPGLFTITFATPFTSPPVVCATADWAVTGLCLALANDVSASSAAIVLVNVRSGDYSDAPFHFIAVGPR